MKQKIWRVKKTDPVLQTILSRELNISPVVAQLLINRGIYTVDAARTFLWGDLRNINPPELMKDMDKAVDRISLALKKGEKILVYGDYDADGITATALLVSLLRRLGGIVNYYVPHRINEGYGLHLPVLERARETGHTLVVTVDCGISAFETVAESNSSGGPDIIITDHHEPPENLPPALALLNPKRPDCNYPFKELAGVGVAFKLGQAVAKTMGVGDCFWQDYLDLVCVGTVADIVPLQGENRILVKEGLSALANTANLGLQALMRISSIKSENIDTTQVSFALAPRLNAAGRLGDARLAVDLLLAENYAEAWELASQLNRENQQRQKIESLVLAEALDMLESHPELAGNKVLVLGSETWHPGVIGIVASRLVEKFYRPALLVSLDGDIGKGSARSIPGFHIYRALEYCKDKLLNFGGHAQAAGFSLPCRELDAFREKINNYADAVLTKESLIPDINLDIIISLNEVTEELIEQVDKLSPYGHGNPHPLFACHNVSLVNFREVGKDGNHLKMLVKDGGITFDGIGFNLSSYAEVLAARDVDLAFVPTVNHWNGKKLLQLEVKDIQPANAGLYFNEDKQRDKTGNILSKFSPGDFKKQYKEEIFLPVFVIKELAKCGIKNNYLTNCEESVSSIESLSQPIEINDWRDYFSREDILGSICSKDQKTVIIVSCPSQTIELFFFLTKRNLMAPEEVSINSLLHENLQGIIKDTVDKNHTRVLISTPEPLHLQEISPVDNLVFYNIPYHSTEFYNLLTSYRATRVHLLYNKKDGEIAAEYLHSLAPERNFLAGFYNLLKTLFQAKRPCFSARDAIKVLAANGFPAAHEFSISIAFKIFKELQLLDYEENNKFQFKLFPPPKQKLNLYDSPTYSYLHQLKASCLKWYQLALEKNFFLNWPKYVQL